MRRRKEQEEGGRWWWRKRIRSRGRHRIKMRREITDDKRRLRKNN